VALVINDVALESVILTWNDGSVKIQGKYAMRDAKGKLIVSQEFNDYSSRKIEFSRDVLSLAEELLDCLKLDIEIATGIKDVVNQAVKEIGGV